MFNTKIMSKVVLSAFLATTIAACTSSPDEIERVPDRSPQAQYTEAKNSLNNKMYNRAITILSGLESRYPFGPLTRQIQLDLMFAYYKSGQFAQALPAIDRFVKLNPNHPQLDYVFYLRGLVNMETGVNAFQDFFGVENADKDMATARDSFNDFKKVIDTYPDSKYVPESKQRMVTLLDKLARHEVVIARYYLRRAAYVAAINRCKYVMEYYPQSSSLVPALEVLVDAYDKLGLNDLKQETEQVLASNR